MGKNKVFFIQGNIGSSKYVVNYHDGIKRNEDGSTFFDIAIFKNKRKMNLFVKNLIDNGYKEI